MAGFVGGVDRSQSTLFPAQLDNYVGTDNPVRAIDVFVDGLDLGKLGFASTQALDIGRPGYAPTTMLKIYIYGYLNRIPSSRRLEPSSRTSRQHGKTERFGRRRRRRRKRNVAAADLIH